MSLGKMIWLICEKIGKIFTINNYANYDQKFAE